MKRLCALILALMLLLSATALASVTPSIDKTEVKAGDTVKVTVSLSEAIEGVYGLSYYLYFDDTLFDYSYEGSAAGDAIEGVDASQKAKTETGTDKKYVLIQYADVTGKGKTVQAGTLYTLAFVAKQDITEDTSASFELKKYKVRDTDRNSIEGDNVEVPTDKAKLDVTVQPATTEPTLKLSNATGKQGDEVTLELSVENNPGIIAANVELTYDTEKLELVKAEDKKVLDGYFTSEDETVVPYKVFWDGGGATADYAEDGALVSYTFKIKEGAKSGDTELTLDLKQIYNFNLQTVDFTVQNGKITIEEPTVVPVESVTLDREAATMILGGDTLTLTATVAPENATDKTVAWTSNNAEVATVEGGVVTAVGVGSAKITATAGEKSASCTVTVKRSASEGYTVELLENQSVNFGSDASVSIKVGVGEQDTRTTYNAADIKLKYDKDKLTYSGDEKIGDVRISDNAEEGTLTLVRYGSDANVGENFVTLKFTAKAAGEAKVEFVSAKVDESKNAITSDAPDATRLNDSITITIGGYKVELGENFTGDAYTTPDEDYTFTAKDTEHYDYADVKATIGEDEVEVTDNGDGTYTIKAEDITGNITVTATVTGKKYDVTFEGTGKDDVTDAADKAQYGVDYTFKLNKESGYTYTVTANVAVTDNGGGSYTIAGSAITQAITVTVAKTAETPTPSGTTSITITGVAAEEVEGGLTHTAENGKDYKLTLIKDAAYDYSMKAGDTPIEPNEDGTYTIPGSLLTGTPLTVTIEKTVAAPSVEVYEYLKLKEAEGEESGKSMWLVLVSGKPVDGSVYSFNDNLMFTSEKYENAYCYLMISDKTLEEVKTDAAALISQKAGSASTVSYEGDVNMTKLTDVNDAQLVYDMYQAKYVEFTENLTVESFLRADMDGSKSIAVKDAAEIVAKIHAEFALEAE